MDLHFTTRDVAYETITLQVATEPLKRKSTIRVVPKRILKRCGSYGRKNVYLRNSDFKGNGKSTVTVY